MWNKGLLHIKVWYLLNKDPSHCLRKYSGRSCVLNDKTIISKGYYIGHPQIIKYLYLNWTTNTTIQCSLLQMVGLTGSKLPLYFTVVVWSLKCTLGRTLNTATPIHNNNLLQKQLTVNQEQALWDFAYLTRSFDLEKKYKLKNVW